MCASPQPCVEFPQVSVHKLIAPQVPVCRSPVPLCARIAPQRFPSFRPGPLSCCVLPVCRPQVPCPVRSTPCRSPQVPCPAVCSNRTPQIHVCRFHFGPRPSDPGLLLSLWSQTLRSTSAALRSTSAAFTLVPNPQIHVCCFHFRPQTLRSTSAALTLVPSPVCCHFDAGLSGLPVTHTPMFRTELLLKNAVKDEHDVSFQLLLMLRRQMIMMPKTGLLSVQC